MSTAPLLRLRVVSDGTPDEVVLAVDFGRGRAEPDMSVLAEMLGLRYRFLETVAANGARQAGVDREVAALLRGIGYGRVVAVLGYCAGASLASRVASELSDRGSPPTLILFNAEVITSQSLQRQFEAAARPLSENHVHSAAEESGVGGAIADAATSIVSLADAYTAQYQALAEQAFASHNLPAEIGAELVARFAALMQYLLLAAQAGAAWRMLNAVHIVSRDHSVASLSRGSRQERVDAGAAHMLAEPRVADVIRAALAEGPT